MTADRELILQALKAQETLRGTLPDDVIDATVAALREQLRGLDARSADPSRRLATILFADVRGFTAMSEQLDAEVVIEVMNELWDRLDLVIADHGGRVDKHIGDAVMAVWGADVAGEDDPERAIRAGLALQAAVAEPAAERKRPLEMRVGINTGPVVFGPAGTSDEYTAIGDSVNVASRLESACAVGGVLISHDTYQHVRGIFDVQPVEPIVAKGKREPLRAYAVHRAKPRAFRMSSRGIEGVATRMIGRDRELETIKTACDDAIMHRKVHSVVVTGDAGVGKSRLLHEFDDWLELRPEPITYFKGRAWPTGENTPLGLFRDLFAHRFQILESDSAEIAIEKFRAGMCGDSEAEDAPAGIRWPTRDEADIVGHWAGFDFSSSAAVQRLAGGSEFGAIAIAYLTRYFRAVGVGPTVVLLEDLHWADDSSLDVVEFLAGELRDEPLLLVAATRPTIFERRPDWRAESRFRFVALDALDESASDALVDEVLQRVEQVPERLRTRISAGADGNPFFVEELVKMLIDEGVIVRGALPTESWRIAEARVDEVAIPATVTGVLQARLDLLSSPERASLQRAAVIGRVFWVAAVEALMHDAPPDEIADALDGVRRREFIFRRNDSAFTSTTEYLFKHALLRDVTYESVLLRERPELHAHAARWLEQNARERFDEYLGVIAEHHAHAGNTQRAAELLSRLGRVSLDAGRLQAARRAFEAAINVSAADPERDTRMVAAARAGLGEALFLSGDYAGAQVALADALVAARQESDLELEVAVLSNLAQVRFFQAEYDAARALLDEALPLARRVGPRCAGGIYELLASRCTNVDLDTRNEWAEASLVAARDAQDETALGRSFNALGMIAGTQGDLDRASTYFSEAAEYAHRSGNLIVEAFCSANIAVINHLLGDKSGSGDNYRIAAERYLDVIGISRELGQRENVAAQLSNLAQLQVRMGDFPGARRGLHESFAIARDVGSTRALLFTLCFYGECLVFEGDRAHGLELLGGLMSHPACDKDLEWDLDMVIGRLTLSDEETAGLKHAPDLDLDVVIGDILEDWND